MNERIEWTSKIIVRIDGKPWPSHAEPAVESVAQALIDGCPMSLESRKCLALMAVRYRELILLPQRARDPIVMLLRKSEWSRPT